LCTTQRDQQCKRNGRRRNGRLLPTFGLSTAGSAALSYKPKPTSNLGLPFFKQNAFDAFPLATSATFGRFFVVTVSLDVFGQSFLFAHLLETAKHLFDRFVAA